MASLKNIIVKYFTSNKLSYWIGFLIILLILASLYAYNYFYLPTQTNKKFKNISNDSAGTSKAFNSGNSVIIRIFTVDWCPYCTKAKPEWNNFKAKYHGTKHNNYTINCIEHDCTNRKDPDVKILVDKYEIKGYPTVKMEKDGLVIDFDAKVSMDALSKFVENVVKK
jgi:thiol-disulfide isomerase/thioredoxin